MGRDTQRSWKAQTTVACAVILGVSVASCGDGSTQPARSPGIIRVVVGTTGASLDDAYAIRLDSVVVGPIGAADSVTIPDVSAGKHQVELTEVAANCHASTNPAAVTVLAHAESRVTFAIACAAVEGSVAITTATVGSDPDADGYVVTVEGMPPQSIGSNATLIIAHIPTGARSVILSSVADNCTVTDSPLRHVSVAGTATVATTFLVTCYQGRIAFWSNRDQNNSDIYTMNPDGTEVTRLTTNTAFDESPAWSPDGRRIAFTSSRTGGEDIYVMQEDGSGVQRLTTSNARDWLPSWSPDGTRIVFTSNRDGNNEIYVMNADGSGQRNLTTSMFAETEARFSPDGKTIVFVSDRDADYGEIYTMDTSGTNVRRLTFSPLYDGRPAYSPDGASIIFYSSRDDPHPPDECCYPELYVMHADGSNQVRLTANSGSDAFPFFAPDASRIVFATSRDGNWEIYTMSASGTSEVNITNSPWVEKEPVWRPAHASAVTTLAARRSQGVAHVISTAHSVPRETKQ